MRSELGERRVRSELGERSVESGWRETGRPPGLRRPPGLDQQSRWDNIQPDYRPKVQFGLTCLEEFGG